MDDLSDLLLSKAGSIFELDERNHFYETFSLLKECEKNDTIPNMVLFTRITTNFQVYLKEIDWTIEANKGCTEGIAAKTFMELYLQEQNLKRKFFYAFKVHNLIQQVLT